MLFSFYFNSINYFILIHHFFGLCGIAIIGFRSHEVTVYPECVIYRRAGLALYFPGWREIVDLDRYTQNCMSHCVVVLCIYYIATDLQLDFGGLWQTIYESDMSRMFYFDDIDDKIKDLEDLIRKDLHLLKSAGRSTSDRYVKYKRQIV